MSAWEPWWPYCLYSSALKRISLLTKQRVSHFYCCIFVITCDILLFSIVMHLIVLMAEVLKSSSTFYFPFIHVIDLFPFFLSMQIWKEKGTLRFSFCAIIIHYLKSVFKSRKAQFFKDGHVLTKYVNRRTEYQNILLP